MIDLCGDLFRLRNGIIFDLRRFMSRNISRKLRCIQYFKLYYSLSQYKGYIRCYGYNQDKEMNCSICFDPFDNINYNNQILIDCGHRFHQHCIERYEDDLFEAGQKFKCPLCNQWYSEYKHKYKFNPNFYRENMFYTQLPNFINIPWTTLVKYRQKVENYVLSSLTFY